MKLALVNLSGSLHTLYWALDIFQKHSDSGFAIGAILEMNVQNLDIKTISSDIPIISLEALTQMYPNEIEGVFLLTHQVCTAESVSFSLYDNGITNVFLPYPIFIDKRIDFLQDTSNAEFRSKYIYAPKFEKPFLFRLETHVVDHCNLKCNGCNNFSSLETGERVRSVEQYDSDLARLKLLFDNICILGLQGGEPLIEPDTALRFAHTARKHFPYSDVRVLTNGILIPSCGDEIFRSLADIDASVHISVYEPTKKILNEIKAKLEYCGVNYYIHLERNMFAKSLTKYPYEDPEENFQSCGAVGCHYLSDGRVYKCPEEELVKNFDARFGTKIYNPDGGVDIYKHDDSWKIVKTLLGACYLCSYCAKSRIEYYPFKANANYEEADWLVPHRYEKGLRLED